MKEIYYNTLFATQNNQHRNRNNSKVKRKMNEKEIYYNTRYERVTRILRGSPALENY